jgi:hypothetical protein
VRACSKLAMSTPVRVWLVIVLSAFGCRSGVVDTAAAQATSPLVGSWRESAWKLCTPATQLTADDVDTPIDDLQIHSDGTFSVMWQGGGAHTTDIPHVFVPVPDYTGHYTLDPAAHRIRMRADYGLFMPPDFSGTGGYRISGNELTLTGIWLGTRRAKHKPDICELTFTRK